MELVARLQKGKSDIAPADITVNLETLQFESALTEEEKKLHYLRARTHAITVTSCAQATFLVSLLNETRQRKKRMKSPQKRSSRILQDRESKDPLKVGILGCGRLGSQLAHCFITYGGIHPRDLQISTRRPETLEYLNSAGVDCFHDNVKLVTSSHLVFLCVLPSQVPAIAEEVKSDIPSTLFLYSLVSSYTTKKLKQLFNTTNIIHPEFSWDMEDTSVEPWDYSVNVTTALENCQTVNKTFPLGEQKGNVIWTNEKLAELMIFVFVNMCSQLKMNKMETLDMLHSIMFLSEEGTKLQPQDFVKKSSLKDQSFPPFDLAKVLESNTAVIKKLRKTESLQTAFRQKYTQVFQDYLDQKAYNELQPK